MKYHTWKVLTEGGRRVLVRTEPPWQQQILVLTRDPESYDVVTIHLPSGRRARKAFVATLESTKRLAANLRDYRAFATLLLAEEFEARLDQLMLELDEQLSLPFPEAS